MLRTNRKNMSGNVQKNSLQKMKMVSIQNKNSALTSFTPSRSTPYQNSINYSVDDRSKILDNNIIVNSLNKKIYSLQQEIKNGCIYGSVPEKEADIELLNCEIIKIISEIGTINLKYKDTDRVYLINEHKHNEFYHHIFTEDEIPDKNINDILSSTVLSFEEKIEILEKYLQKNIIKNNQMTNQFDQLPSINITKNPSVEDFFVNLKEDIEKVISPSNKKETAYEILLNNMKLTEKEYGDLIRMFKKISPPTNDLFSNKRYDEIDLSKISQTYLFKNRHAFSNTTRDGETLSQDPKRINLAERYELYKKTRKISKTTNLYDIILMINSLNITSEDLSESVIEYVNSTWNDFKKGILEKILSSPESIQVFVKISDNDRPIGKVSGITSSDKSAAILSLMANSMKINIFSNTIDKSIDSTKLFSNNFNDISNFIMHHNDDIVTQIYSYISREILKLQELMKTDEINSYHFPPLVIFTDINVDINTKEINDFISQLSILLLDKEISISPPFFTIYNLGENQLKSNENILQWSGWSEIEYVTILKKIHDRDTKKLDIIRNDETEPFAENLLDTHVNDEESEVNLLDMILNNPTSKMIEEILNA
jgi:hypothetical protein